MAGLALPTNLSLVTIADRDATGWKRLLEWPERAQAHVPFQARNATERNLLGARLDAAVTQAEGPVLLLAQGAACLATAWWARLSPSSYVSRVAGALFFQPAEDDAGRMSGFLETFASPRMALPFPSIVVEGRDSTLPSSAQVEALAQDWGSRMLIARDQEPTLLARTRRVIARFAAAVVDHDVATGEKLLGRHLKVVPRR